jgi:hypothetical protein
VAAYDYFSVANASVENVSYNNRTYATEVSAGTGTADGIGLGPIPYVVRYAPGGSVAFLYIQTDRVLVTSASMTTTTNYTVAGPSAPTVTAVTFTTAKSFLRLTLSGALTFGQSYTLSVKQDTFSNGVPTIANTVGVTPIYVEA